MDNCLVISVLFDSSLTESLPLLGFVLVLWFDDDIVPKLEKYTLLLLEVLMR